MSQSKPTFNFMLLGKTGAGKSATGNKLIGREKVFKASNKVTSCTKISQLECGSFENYVIKVVDTPGLKDTNDDVAVTMNSISDGMGLLPNGFDALLLVMKYGDKCTDEFINIITELRATFGDVFAKDYCIIVFTHGDNFESAMSDEDEYETFDDYCKQIKEPLQLLSLLKECEYRIVLFNNTKFGNREESVNKLLKLVHTLKPRSQRYNLDSFAKCATQRKEFFLKSKLPQLIAPIQEKLSFLNEDLEKAIANPDAKTDQEIKERAQQLLDTIDEESQGTSVMDDLKEKVKRSISMIDALSSKKKERQQMLRELKELVDIIHHPPTPSRIILQSLLWAGNAVVGVTGTVVGVATFDPLIASLGMTCLASVGDRSKKLIESVSDYVDSSEKHDYAVKKKDSIEKKLQQS